MTKYQKEVKKAEKIIKKALSKIEWENQGFRVISTGAKSGNVTLSGPQNEIIQFDLSAISYTPRN